MIEWLKGFIPGTPSGVFWLGIGILGQALFGARWFVQLVASERTGKSTVPTAFWWMSILGGVLVLSYGLHDRNLVVLVGQWGILVYLRNLVLLRRERRRSEAAA